MTNKLVFLSTAAVLATTFLLDGCGTNANNGVVAVSTSIYPGKIKEELELHGDGTYQQKITDPQGKSYQNSGTWQKYTEKAGPPGVPSDGSQVQLKGHAEPNDVVNKKSVNKAEKMDFIVPAFSFHPPKGK